MKIIFLGTPDFAVKPLQAIINSKHTVLAVVTQPDREVGRGKKIEMPPVKKVALENNISVYQFEKIRKQGVEVLKQLNADVMVTCAYGQILNKAVLDIAPNGVINVHGSLLPKYRGASPIQCAIINGETETGVTIMKTDVGIDTGDILLSKKCNIDLSDSTETLINKVSELGASAIVEALDLIEAGKAKFVPQNESEMSYYKMFAREDGKIDFNKTASEICNFVRGINPWPGAFFTVANQTYKVFACEHASKEIDAEIGEIVCSSPKTGLVVKCNNGFVEITEIQAPNSKRMSAKAYLNGKKIEVGAIIK